jgi:hypothetical protein
MNNIPIRKVTESDLPILEKLMTELIESMDNKEAGVSPKFRRFFLRCCIEKEPAR